MNNGKKKEAPEFSQKSETPVRDRRTGRYQAISNRMTWDEWERFLNLNDKVHKALNTT